MAIFRKLTSGIFKAIGLVSTPGKAPKALPTVTRDEAAAQVAVNDELLRRKGGAADMLTGTGGAEAAAGAKTTLGS
ncbi:hypothetical protein [Sphingobium sp. YG1]|uniref:hypothetical protein n=1 Tax=Sphingobium sp. YG1 TaxID=2082188 RepID=UPI000DBAE21C|nr:hypothetical protein [Sphingobium sp. YG1]BBC99105.1 hypothetical protein YGS_C1P0361 [Sphingobium sp. YG1]